MGQSAAGSACYAEAAFARAVAPFGMAEAKAGELGQVRALAARMISPDVASKESLAAIHRHTGYGLYVTRDGGGVSGFLALIMLNRAGLTAMKAETFDTLRPRLDHLTTGAEEPSAIYCWGIAAADKAAAVQLVPGSWAARGVFPDMPYFVKAATEAGKRLLTVTMDFMPYPGSTTGLLWWPRYRGRRDAA